jgi:hypothetical protein
MAERTRDDVLEVRAARKAGDAARLARFLEASESKSARRKAAEYLGMLGASSERSALLNALDDRELTTRVAAAEALGKVRATEAVPRLLELLETAEAGGERVAAARALGAIGDPRALPSLIGVLEDDAAQLAGIEGLGALGDPAALVALEPLAPRRLAARWARRDAVQRLRRARAEQEDRALSPLVPMARAMRFGIATRLARPAIVALVAILVLGGRPGTLLLVGAATTVLVIAWLLFATQPEVVRHWIPAARPLPPIAPAPERRRSTLARQLKDEASGLVVDLPLLALLALVLGPAVAGGLVAGNPRSGRIALNLRALAKWQRANGAVLLRERLPGDDDGDRVFAAKAAGQGLEPQLPEPESGVLPITPPGKERRPV